MDPIARYIDPIGNPLEILHLRHTIDTRPVRNPTSVKRANGTHPCLPASHFAGFASVWLLEKVQKNILRNGGW